MCTKANISESECHNIVGKDNQGCNFIGKHVTINIEQ